MHRFEPDLMIDHDHLALFLMLNFTAYIIVQIPLGIKTILSDKDAVRKKTSLREYYPLRKWSVIFSIIVLATSYFFIIFIFWPFYHLLFGSQLIDRFLLGLPHSTSFQIIGMVIVTAATTINLLGRLARGEGYISDGVPDKLSTGSGHKVVRHPLYASYCYYFIGFQLIFQSYLTLPLLLGIIAYYSASKQEEKVLVQEFGQEYRDYQQKVGMLVPFVGRRNK